ncbi:unnamed protein product [Clonostachys solani]|uniref:DUF7908 domain-containing protein n=1 Tax=Clonostachys solani TaxID=160281 RepID=A0A9N9W1V6_9HYPO|nr:unnamed protein product [Clonostachys solani]
MRSLLVLFLSYFGLGASLAIATDSFNQDGPVNDTRLSNSHVERVHATAPDDNSPKEFLLLLNPFHPLKDAAREIEPLYITPFGISSACQYATEFRLIGDQLHTGKHIVSTEPGIQRQPLLGGSSNGTISGGFFQDGDELQWLSSDFASPTALFCLSSSNVVFAVFDTSRLSNECIRIHLELVPLSRCLQKRPITTASASQTPLGARDAKPSAHIITPSLEARDVESNSCSDFRGAYVLIPVGSSGELGLPGPAGPPFNKYGSPTSLGNSGSPAGSSKAPEPAESPVRQGQSAIPSSREQVAKSGSPGSPDFSRLSTLQGTSTSENVNRARMAETASLAQMEGTGNKDHKAYKEQQGNQEYLEYQEYQECQGNQDHKAYKEHRGQQAYKVPQEQKETKAARDHRASKARRETKGFQGPKVSKAYKDCRVSRACKVCKVSQVRREIKAIRDYKVHKVFKANQEYKASKARKAIKENLDHKAYQVKRVHKVCKASQARREIKAIQDYKVYKVFKASQDQKANKARKAIKENLDHKAYQVNQDHKASRVCRACRETLDHKGLKVYQVFRGNKACKALKDRKVIQPDTQQTMAISVVTLLTKMKTTG